MKVNRTIRYRLYPATYAKHQALHGTAGACRHVWNHFVGKLKDDYAFCGDCNFYFMGKYNKSRQLGLAKTFTLLRQQTKWLQGYSAYIVKDSLKPIETVYKEFFNGHRGLPKFKSKYCSTPSFPINYACARIQGNSICIQKIGWMKFEGTDKYKGEKFVSGRVKYECGKWYAYIVYEVEVTENPHLINEVGLDRNVGQVALSDGTIYHLPNLERKEARRMRYQRMMARRVKGSNRRKLARHKLQKAYQAERFARANWAHQTSKLIADKYDIVYIEDLNTVGMTKSAKGTTEAPGKNVKQKTGLNRSILRSVWGKLEQCLAYKSQIEKVPAAYTSQTCNKCGYVDKKNRKTQSEFKCIQCGHTDNADINAALNILASVTGASGRGDGDIVLGKKLPSSRSVKRQKNLEIFSFP